MAFNISRFKSTLDKYGGPGKSSLFEVNITKQDEPNSSLTSRDATFFCTAVNFPGVVLEKQTMSLVGQMPLDFPSKIQPQPISARFMVDSDHQVLTFFHNWIQKVLNYSTIDESYAGSNNADELQLPYELGYKDEYACDITIKHYSVESVESKYYEVTLKNAYPVSVGDIELAWESSNQFVIITVNFSYDAFHYSGDRTGRQMSRAGNEKSLFETLGDLAGFASTVRGSFLAGRPRSIQDAVNRLTTIRNSYGGLSDFFNNSPKNPETGGTGSGGG
jgi:hypothetical protein